MDRRLENQSNLNSGNTTAMTLYTLCHFMWYGGSLKKELFRWKSQALRQTWLIFIMLHGRNLSQFRCRQTIWRCWDCPGIRYLFGKCGNHRALGTSHRKRKWLLKSNRFESEGIGGKPWGQFLYTPLMWDEDDWEGRQWRSVRFNPVTVDPSRIQPVSAIAGAAGVG